MKNQYTQGTKRRRGNRATSMPNAGTAASITTNVAVNSHCN